MSRTPEQEDLFTKSGKTSMTSDAVVSFLYELMRDKLSVGEVHQLVMRNLNRDAQTTEYTNGWLASYASYLADKLRTGK